MSRALEIVREIATNVFIAAVILYCGLVGFQILG